MRQLLCPQVQKHNAVLHLRPSAPVRPYPASAPVPASTGETRSLNPANCVPDVPKQGLALCPNGQRKLTKDNKIDSDEY